jgi:anti-anti-sigma factor
MSDLMIRSAPILELPRSAEIVLEGAINGQNAADLKEKVDKALDRRVAFVSILMKNVSQVNSSGFGYFMDLAMLVQRRGGHLVLVEVQPKIKVIISNLGMVGYFRFEPSAETARAYLRAEALRVARSPRVVPLDGPDEGVEFPIVGTSIKIGTDPKCTIPIRHPEVERSHAEIYRTGDQCFVKDMGSRFGTYVGTRKVSDENLKSGDIVRVGGVRLAYVPAGAPLKV